jgi:hypothetical protein
MATDGPQVAQSGAVAREAKKKARRRLYVVATLAAIVHPFLFYAFSMNVFLSTPLFDKIINGQDPDAIHITYRRGWSLFPSHIHARDLSIRGRDSNVEWELTIQKVEFEVALRSLIRQNFNVSMVDGTGVTFRLRSRREREPQTPDEFAQIADLPPIRGLPPYAVRPPPGDTREVWSDDDYRLWSAHLENVVARDVRQIWIERDRFEGAAHITGRFALRPLREVDVGPIYLETRHGVVRRGDHTLLTEVNLTATIAVVPFDPRTVRGGAIVKGLALSTEGSLRSDDVSLLPLPLPPTMLVTGAVDAKVLSLRIDNGGLAPGTHVETDFVGQVDGMFHRAKARAELRVDVIDDAGTPRLEVRSAVIHGHVARAGPNGAELLGTAEIAASGSATRLELTDFLGDLHATVQVDARLPDAHALMPYVQGQAPLRLDAGEVNLQGRVEGWLADRRADAQLTARATGVRLGLPSVEVLGKARVLVEVVGYSWHKNTVDGAVARVDDMYVDARHLPSNATARGNVMAALDLGAWQLDGHSLDVNNARLTVSNARGALGAGAREGAGAKDEWTAKRLEVRASAPKLDTKVPTLRQIDKITADIVEVAMPDLRVLGRLLPKEWVSVTGGWARMNGSVTVEPSRSKAFGSVVLALTRVQAATGENRIVGDLRLSAKVSGFDEKTNELVLSGTHIDVRDLSVRGSSAESSGWAGRLTFQRASLTFGDLRAPPEFNGTVALSARDGHPFLALALGNSIASNFVALAQMPNLEASARLHVDPARILVSSIDARGGDIWLRGLYGRNAGRTGGAFVASKGELSAGARLDNDGMHVHLFGLDSWLRGQTHEVLAAVNAPGR